MVLTAVLFEQKVVNFAMRGLDTPCKLHYFRAT